MSSLVGLVEWPAMAVTVVGSWLVASGRVRRRKLGFWAFLMGNVLWTAWGLYDKAYALVLLQACLVAVNVRGLRNNAQAAEREST